MNKKTKAALRAIAAGATFAAAAGDVVDNYAQRTNHPAWYEHYPLEGLVQLNFGERENKNLSLVARNVGSMATIAGAARNVYFLSPPDAMVEVRLSEAVANGSGDVNDKAAALIIQQIRSVATTTAQYQKEDARRLVKNVRSIVAALSIARRVSGEFNIVDTYDADAYYKYVVMGLANKYKYSDIAKGIANMRAQLAALTPLVRNLIPINIDLIERTKWLFSNIFADSPSAKFSTKQFTCTQFPIEKEDGSQLLFCFEPGPVAALRGSGDSSDPYEDAYSTSTHPNYDTRIITAATFEDIPQLIRQMIAEVTSQNMASRVLGDILKAFGERAFMTLPPLDPVARTPIVYDEDVLQQIQNATFYPACFNLDSGKLQSMPGTAATPQRYGTALLTEHLVNTYRDVVTPGKLLSLTRLSPFTEIRTGVVRHLALDSADVAASIQEIVTCGTEVPISYQWFDFSNNEDDLRFASPYGTYMLGDTTVNNTAARNIAYWSEDDYAPNLPMMGDTNSYAVIDAQNWALMNAKDASTYTTYATLSLMMIHELVQKADTFVFVA